MSTKKVMVRVSKEELQRIFKDCAINSHCASCLSSLVTLTGELEDETWHCVKHKRGGPTGSCPECAAPHEPLGWDKTLEDKWYETISGLHVLDAKSPPLWLYGLVRRVREEALAEGRTCCLWDMGNDGNKMGLIPSRQV